MEGSFMKMIKVFVFLVVVVFLFGCVVGEWLKNVGKVFEFMFIENLMVKCFYKLVFMFML